MKRMIDVYSMLGQYGQMFWLYKTSVNIELALPSVENVAGSTRAY